MATSSTATLLLFSAALLFSVSTAASPPSPESISVEECVKLLFDPPPESPTFWKRILCRDLLRKAGKAFRTTGKLSPEYLKALKDLPRFKNNPAELKSFLCGLGPPRKAARKLGCSKKVAAELIV